MPQTAAMRRIAILLIALFAAAGSPLAAQSVVYEDVIEETGVVAQGGSDRFVDSEPSPALPSGIATYGPFRVLDGTRAALIAATDARSPGQFAAMLRVFPQIRTIEMIECPGTDDDRANLRLGRMIHARGIAMHVPGGGSVRSGAVELFLAGSQRIADPGAEFAVHSWADEDGHEPRHFAADAPENRLYIDYYRAVGMSEAQANAFYAMTNSVPNADAKWLTAAEMALWVRLDAPERPVQPLDLALAVN